MRFVSTPKPWFAAKASPESLSRTRLKAGVGVVIGSVPGFPLATSSILLCHSEQSLCHPERSAEPMQFCRRPRLHGSFALLRMTGMRNLNRNKKAPRRAPGLFAFRLCRLRDGDGLACVSHLEAGKAAHGDILAQFADFGRNQLRDRDGLVLVEGLLEQAHFFVELLHLAIHHLLGDVGGLSAGNRLREKNLLLAGEVRSRDVFLAYIL